MRFAVTLLAALIAEWAFAKLPPPTDEAKAQAAEVAAKSAWTDKVAGYQLCRAQDRVAESYRQSAQTIGASVTPPVETPACTDPGPYVPPVAAASNRPLEAAGAHSPPETATAPPSTKTPTAEIAAPTK